MLHSIFKAFFITLICASIPLTVYIAVPDIIFPDNELFERLYQVFIIALCSTSSVGLIAIYVKNKNHYRLNRLLAIDEQWISPNVLKLCIFLSVCSIFGYFGHLIWEFLFFFLVDCGNPIDISKQLPAINFKFWCDVLYEICLLFFFLCLIKHISIVNDKKRQYRVPVYWSWLTMVTAITVFFKIILAHIKETVEVLLHHHDAVDYFNCSSKQIEDFSGLFYMFPYITGLAYNGSAEFLPLAFFLLYETDKLFRKGAHAPKILWKIREDTKTFKHVLLTVFSMISIIFSIALVSFFLYYISSKNESDSDWRYQINLIIRMIFCFFLSIQAVISSNCLESNGANNPNMNGIAEDGNVTANHAANRISGAVSGNDVEVASEISPLLGRGDPVLRNNADHIDHSKSHDLDGKILFYSMLPVVSVLSSHVLCSLFFLVFLKGEKVYILFGVESFVNVVQLWSQNYFLNNLLSTGNEEVNSFGKFALKFSAFGFMVGNFLFWFYDVLQFKFIFDVKTPSSNFVPSLLWLVMVVVGFPAAILFRFHSVQIALRFVHLENLWSKVKSILRFYSEEH